jgi:hypothetical protein
VVGRVFPNVHTVTASWGGAIQVAAGAGRLRGAAAIRARELVHAPRHMSQGDRRHVAAERGPRPVAAQPLRGGRGAAVGSPCPAICIAMPFAPGCLLLHPACSGSLCYMYLLARSSDLSLALGPW